MRARRPPKFSKEAAWLHLLAYLDRTQPKRGAARLIYEALDREGKS